MNDVEQTELAQILVKYKEDIKALKDFPKYIRWCFRLEEITSMFSRFCLGTLIVATVVYINKLNKSLFFLIYTCSVIILFFIAFIIWIITSIILRNKIGRYVRLGSFIVLKDRSLYEALK